MSDMNEPPAWYVAQQEERKKRNKIILIIVGVLVLGLALGLSAASLIANAKQDKLDEKDLKGTSTASEKESWLPMDTCLENGVTQSARTFKVISAQRGILTAVRGRDGQIYEVDFSDRCRQITERVKLAKVAPEIVAENALPPETNYVDDTPYIHASSGLDANMSMDMPTEPAPPIRTRPAAPENDDPFYEPPTYRGQKERVEAQTETEKDPFED